MIELKLWKWRVIIVWDFSKYHVRNNPKRKAALDDKGVLV